MITDAQATQWGVDQAFETLAMLTAHSDSAKGAMKFLRGEIERLRKLVYVPGVWRCAKCDFRLTRVALNVVTGTASADDTTGEKCPNCQSTLWRVTERDAGNDLVKRCQALQLRVNELEAIPTVVESDSGNPGWVDAKDAVRMLAALRANLKAMCGWAELLAENQNWTRDNAASFWASRDAARKFVPDALRPERAPPTKGANP